MSQAEFARRTGLSTKHINQIARGTAGLSTEVASAFEKVTGMPARFWYQLDSDYRQHKARLEEDASLERQLDALDRLPIKALVERGWLKRRSRSVEQLRELLEFFGVANLDALDEVWLAHTALRTSRSFTPNQGALAAWLRITELQASAMDTQPFDAKRCTDALEDFRSLTRMERTTWVKPLERRCAEVGIALVIEKELPRCRINGATRWLFADKAMVALSLRHRRHDILWFTFFHELAHLLRHGKRDTFIDAEGTGINQDLELDADRFAARTLIPPEHEAELLSLGTVEDVAGFAERINIDPSIVVGRMQHEHLIPHKQWQSLIPKYRFHDDRR